MNTIHLLPDHIIAQIAAGEVIERPAYAVKELIENAIDAQATQITVDLVESGLSKLIITDNGIGMTKEDVVESYKLHTTSKITNTSSLLSIKSLGFRGEALASIAAMSYLTIETKTPTDIFGTKIIIDHGKLKNITSLGMPTGTRVIVEHLFSQVPARKKFLKSKKTELRQILDIIVAQAITHPSITYTISHEGKILFQTPISALLERLQNIFGSQIKDKLYPVKFHDAYIHITGFIGHPELSSTILPKQFLSINQRPVNDRLIQLAVKEAYGIMLEENAQPSWFLSLSIPYEMVDVNIHPRKEQVNFSDQRLLFDTISKAVQQVLAENKVTFYSSSVAKEKITQTILGKQLKESVLPWNTALLTKEATQKIVQLNNLYILIPTSSGLIIIDQHAAHERILYEKFRKEFIEEKKKKISSPLPLPILLNLSPSEKVTLEESITELELWGFRIEHFSDNTFNISEVPQIFRDRNIEEIIVQFLNHFSLDSFIPAIDSETKKLLAFLACRTAVKAGDPLTQDQMKDIIKELDNYPEAITCPHGRPIKIVIPVYDLDRQFKRR